MKRLLCFVILFYAILMVAHRVSRNNWIDTNAKGKTEQSEDEGKTDKPSKFFQFHAGIRTREDQAKPGYRAAYKWIELAKAKDLAQKRRSTSARKKNGVIAWKERGPANVPGRTRALFNIPGDPNNNTWLAGAATGGIWRTIDGGMSWSERSIGFPALPISSFGADKTVSAIYAGTGESVSSFYSAIGNGIFKSTDKGITWTQVASTFNNPDFSITTRLIVNPDNANIVVVTTVPHNLTTGRKSAIMRTVDGGATWSKVKEIEGVFEQIIATPGNFNVQYASEHGVGVWKSVDAGVTWALSNDGMMPDGRIEISVSPVSSTELFASAEGGVSGTGSDLYYSSNAGQSWSLVDVRFNNNVVDFLEGQGFYDNMVMCDPYTSKRAYVGGVSVFRISLGTSSSTVGYYNLTESGTESFLLLQSFSGIPYSQSRLDAATAEAGQTNVEIRFGPGELQKAHRFQVPADRTNGLQVNDYTYQNYVDVPFEVWDVTSNRQLMVSFRDQNRNGKFDLVPEHLTNNGIDYLINSREYLYIHNVAYNASASSAIAKTGGQQYKMMYNVFPALQENATWDETALPASKVIITYASLTRLSATTVTVADGRGSFDDKNDHDQTDLTNGVHPDHHCMIPLIVDESTKTYKLLLANDGGVFVSKASATPGVTQGDWEFRGFGLNTTQFYGADKRPGAEQYFGGAQDNGTRISANNTVASAETDYFFAIDGDGFECLWHSKDPTKLLGTTYYGRISKSTNSGSSWRIVAQADESEFPFVTKLANSKDFPDRVFTVGTQGVYVSENFGETWTLTSIPSKFVISTATYLDVEVSRADPDIVWAGSGMNSTEEQRSIFVSADGGKTFTATTNYGNAVLGNITRLASHPRDPETAFALFSFANSPKILRTTDLGQTWEDISRFEGGTGSTNGFPDVAVYCLYVRSDDSNIIWAGTEIGIVESQDNGQTWTLLEEFPHVPVWDMKGQDNEVVIATHGRGIWTATLEKKQQSIATAEVVAAGTAPSGEFVLRIGIEEPLDSVHIFANTTKLKSIKLVDPGVSDHAFNDIEPGELTVKMISFKNGLAFQSTAYTTSQLQLSDVSETYTTHFRSSIDLFLQGMAVRRLEGPVSPAKGSLQTTHPYLPQNEYHATILVPIRVSAETPFIYYTDVAIVEPENDRVLVEATLNGLDWIKLSEYDARLSSVWENVFLSGGDGDNSHYVNHIVDLSPFLSEGSLVLFRFRLASNASVNAWGWAIQSVSIQASPTGVEEPVLSSTNVFPNPANEITTLEYFLRKPSVVNYEIADAYGRSVQNIGLGIKPSGNHTSNIDVTSLQSGSYLVILRAGNERTVKKLLIFK